MAKDVKCKYCKKLKNHWCKAVLDSPDEDITRECRHFIHKTNADRIRAMSDEGLAKWIAKTQIANVAEALNIAHIPFEQQPGLQELTEKECLEWLQQPAKGE